MDQASQEQAGLDHGDLAGRWVGIYRSNRVPETQVTLIFQQLTTEEHEQAQRRVGAVDYTSETVVGTYKSADGAIGTIQGRISGNTVTADATQVTPTCLGSFRMLGTLDGQTYTWSFEGQDCLGDEQGKGTASRERTPLA